MEEFVCLLCAVWCAIKALDWRRQERNLSELRMRVVMLELEIETLRQQTELRRMTNECAQHHHPRRRHVRVHGELAMIRKHGGKYVVMDSKGKRKLGSHDSYNKALKQLAAIEHSKKTKGSKQ